MKWFIIWLFMPLVEKPLSIINIIFVIKKYGWNSLGDYFKDSCINKDVYGAREYRTALNTLFKGKTGKGLGGVYGVTATNCAIYNNSATGNGGGGAFQGTLTNCSVIRNKSTNGAGTYNTILRNTVVYGNIHTTGVKQNVVNTNSSVETYSAFEVEVRAGEGNILLSLNNKGDATSPCFQSLSTDAGVVDEIYISNPHICNDSFLVDKGLNSLNTSGWGSEYDLAGLPRKVDNIDIGAYENQKTI